MDPVLDPVDPSIVVYSETTMSVMSNVHLPQNYSYTMDDEVFKKNVQDNEVARALGRGCASSDEYTSKPFRPMIIVGPSGVGKSTLIKALTDKYPDSFGFSVSHTTRAPREGEKHGVNYFYIPKEEF